MHLNFTISNQVTMETFVILSFWNLWLGNNWLNIENIRLQITNVVDLNLPFYFHMKDHLRQGNPHIFLILYCSNTILCINQLSCFCCRNARTQEKKHDYEN